MDVLKLFLLFEWYYSVSYGFIVISSFFTLTYLAEFGNDWKGRGWLMMVTGNAGRI